MSTSQYCSRTLIVWAIRCSSCPRHSSTTGPTIGSLGRSTTVRSCPFLSILSMTIQRKSFNSKASFRRLGGWYRRSRAWSVRIRILGTRTLRYCCVVLKILHSLRNLNFSTRNWKKARKGAFPLQWNQTRKMMLCSSIYPGLPISTWRNISSWRTSKILLRVCVKPFMWRVTIAS